MKDAIYYVPRGQFVDLAGGLDQATYAWLESLQGHCPKADPTIICGGCGCPLYLRHNTAQDGLHGVHHEQAGCRTLEIRQTAPMSDEHKRECEYHALAGQAAGFDADMEVTTSRGTRVDVVVANAGFEIQRAGLNVDSAKKRTARSMASGIDIVSWFHDQPSDPVWYGKVPSYSTTVRTWDRMPPLRTVTAVGPRILIPRTCTVGNFEKCPEGRRNWCGQRHPHFEPWVGLLVDDVVAGMAAGRIVAAQIGKRVQLLSATDLSRYEELTQRSAQYTPALPPPASAGREAQNRRVECWRAATGWSVRPESCEQLPLQLQMTDPS